MKFNIGDILIVKPTAYINDMFQNGIVVDSDGEFYTINYWEKGGTFGKEHHKLIERDYELNKKEMRNKTIENMLTNSN